MTEFAEEITDVDRLRELMPLDETSGAAIIVSDKLNDAARRFIALFPIFVIASKSQGGLIDVSTKGDPARSVKVLDDQTFAIPYRLGNHRQLGQVCYLLHTHSHFSFFFGSTITG